MSAVPVVVGVGQVTRWKGEGDRDAVGLMVEAATVAADDAGAPELLKRIDRVLVPEGTWPSQDAGRVVATKVGSPGAATLLARIGVLQTTLFAEAASAIADGYASVVLVVGGEAKASGRDGATSQSPTMADLELEPQGDIITALEIERGMAVPAQSYALQEDAIRFHRRETPAQHRVRLAELWSAFSEVAASNPHAWDRERRTTADIADPRSTGNRMVSSPYTKRHCSQWNVDQAVAVLMVSGDVADEIGVPAERRVHPIAVVDSNAMITLSARAELHRSPSFEVAGHRMAEATGVEASDVDHLEIYSCFPSAVQIQASELGIDTGRQLTVTGGMAFAGGPLNSAGLHGVASMVDVLRAHPGSTGLVTAVSGMITKGGLSLWSTNAPEHRWAELDVTDQVLNVTSTIEVDAGYAGEVEVEATTVAFDREGPALTVVLGRTANWRRAVASSNDRDLAESTATEPLTGGFVRVDGPVLLGR